MLSNFEHPRPSQGPVTAIKEAPSVIPLAVPDLSGREAEYLEECIRSGFVSSVGPFVGRFETLVADYAGATAAVATSSGTTAIHAALVAVGVERDDLVILPTLTFIASANAISHCGATPWLLDVDSTSWSLDTAALERVLSNETRRHADRLVHVASGRRVAAILPVHTLGMPADMDTIGVIAKAFGLPVVADGAAALGATYKGRRMGTLADLTAISFNGNKTMTAGGGGAVVGQDPTLLKLVRHLTTTARVGRDYLHDRVGFNYRMTNLNAAVGCAQLERADALVAAKRRIRRTYDDAFRRSPDVQLFPELPDRESACWFSGLVLTGEQSTQVPIMCEQLRAADIEARPFWRPMHLQPPYRRAPGGPFPVSDDLHARVLTLPCSTHLSRKEQERVIAAVHELL